MSVDQTKKNKTMNNLSIILKREYLTRVKKRSFIILTFLGPIFFAALMIAPSLLMIKSDKMESSTSITTKTVSLRHSTHSPD